MKKCIIGIDEAGRGPIAGPVAIGAVCIPAEKYTQVKSACRDIVGKDSKKLSEKQRDEWFVKIQQMENDGLLQYTAVMTGALQIDSNGIVLSIRRCIYRALKQLCPSAVHCRVMLDGGLSAPKIYRSQKTIIKGDEKECVISLASICAKVKRDQKMKRLHKKFPEYGFAQHKGYGTKSHCQALSIHGMCDEHRTSFLR